jgi:predicted HNH restriction endonuclease
VEKLFLSRKKKGDKEDEGDTYIETHHLIEVYKLIKGTLGVSNLITVCANHHRQFHFGNIEIKLNTKDILKLKIDGKEIAIKKIKL